MSDETQLALDRLCVAAKGRDDLEPYVRAARDAGASAEQIARHLRRILGDAVPEDLLDLARRQKDDAHG